MTKRYYEEEEENTPLFKKVSNASSKYKKSQENK